MQDDTILKQLIPDNNPKILREQSRLFQSMTTLTWAKARFLETNDPYFKEIMHNSLSIIKELWNGD